MTIYDCHERLILKNSGTRVKERGGQLDAQPNPENKKIHGGFHSVSSCPNF
jgi:hypothetical protein